MGVPCLMLSPIDIHNKEFKRSLRGYDVDEVNEFLDLIVRDMEVLIREKNELEQQVEELTQQLEQMEQMEREYLAEQQMGNQPAPYQPDPYQDPYQDMTQTGRMNRSQLPSPMDQSAATLASMEQSIHKSIRVAQEVAEEVRLNAKKEAELIVQEAEKNADRIINEALQKARAIHGELTELKQKAAVYRARFRNLVRSHLEILENSDWESLDEIENDLDDHSKKLDLDSAQSIDLDSSNNDYMMDHALDDDQSYDSHYGDSGYGDSSFDDNGYDDNTFGVSQDTDFGFNINTMEEVAPTYMDDHESQSEERSPRELRRTSRKLKKKAMF